MTAGLDEPSLGALSAPLRGEAPSPRSPRALALRFAPIVVPWLMLAIMLGIYENVQGGVFTLDELNTETAATLTLLLVATGQTIVVLLGGIDLSVGGVVSLTTSLAATQFGAGGGPLLGWSLALVAMGAGGGLVNGILISRVRLQPFIVTLATWSIWSGVALWVLPTEGGHIPHGFIDWVNARSLGAVTSVWLLAGLIVFWLWFKRTRLALEIRAVGSSESSSFLLGVPTEYVTIAAYVLSGVFAALGGLFLATQTASGSPTVGNDYILNSVAAVVIGGTSLFGGRGGLGGTIAGAFILTIIGDVIFALNVSSFWTPIISGLLLIVAVLANSLTELYTRRQAAR